MKSRSALILVLVSFIFVLLFVMFPNSNYKKEVNYQKTLYSTFKNISSNIGSSYKLVSNKTLSNKVINLVYYNEETDDYMAYLIDSLTGKLTTYKSLIKKENLKEFNEVIELHVNRKYPKFVSEGIFSDDTTKYFYIYDDKILIYFKNVITSPQINDKLFISIDNNEIKDYLNYDYILNDEYSIESGYDYDPSKKYIAFTFDDGPSPKNTKDIVNYLKDNKFHATFFMLGNLMVRNPDIVNYVKDNENEIGSHTYSHQNLKRISMDKVKNEVNLTEDVYHEITGENFVLLRPPYGAINDKIKEEFNYSYIIWSVDTLDWKYRDSDYLYNYVINNVNDGDIVLMHDIHETTKIAVEKILPELYVRGYRVVSVSELAKIKGITLENKTTYRSIK